jgi:hypothetical protein
LWSDACTVLFTTFQSQWSKQLGYYSSEVMHYLTTYYTHNKTIVY